MKEELIIRKAEEKDISAISRIHAHSWQTAYASIFPKEYLENDLEGERRETWVRKYKELSPDDFVLVAEKKGHIIEFACVIANYQDYDALLDNLHVLPEEKGKKIGSRLLCSVARELKAKGRSNFCLWVFEDNTPARKFYQKMSGKEIDRSFYEIHGKQIPEIRCVWADLDVLLLLDTVK
jgi:ribosomal protein S18 acetylase RimI-like enzyme